MPSVLRRSVALVILGALVVIVACATVPITGRNQLTIIPDGQLYGMSFQQYDDVLAQAELSDDEQQVAMIRRVGRRIQDSVERFMTERGHADELDGYAWEFNLIESDQINAWCMPGGKVAFYTGILPVCDGEDGVAVVMGHEVAHAIAEHGNERMSQMLLTQLGGMALNEALSSKPEQTQQLAMTAFAVGAQYGVLLPYSRTHESEADEMGLIFMAMAGYDPREAPRLWRRMAEAGGAQPPEFLSTHPSHESRIENLNAHMDEALEYYRR